MSAAGKCKRMSERVTECVRKGARFFSFHLCCLDAGEGRLRESERTSGPSVQVSERANLWRGASGPMRAACSRQQAGE